MIGARTHDRPVSQAQGIMQPMVRDWAVDRSARLLVFLGAEQKTRRREVVSGGFAMP